MKQVIEGCLFDTDADEFLIGVEEIEFYRRANGQYYFYDQHADEPKEMIKPVTRVEAFNWLQFWGFDGASKALFPDIYQMNLMETVTQLGVIREC